MTAPGHNRTTLRNLLALGLGVVLAAGLFQTLAWMMQPRGESSLALTPRKSMHPQQVARAPAKVKLLRQRQIAQAKPHAEEEKLAPTDDLNGQVVETARPLVEQAPKNARYLGRYDMRVDREVKSQGRKSPGRDLGRLHIENPSPLQSPQSKSKDPTVIPDRPTPARQAAGEAGDRADRAPTTLGPGPAPKAAKGDAGEREGSVVVKGAHDGLLLPATSPGNVMHNIQALAGSPGGNDYLPDVEDEGETNLLNTRKFRYWDFFQRVKDRVSSEWEPGSVWRSRDPQGNRFGVRDRLTILRVTLDPEGALKQLAVRQQSGLEFLDDEARRAFAAAGPFPNPPDGLRNERGEIQFEFGFMFEISTRRFKFYRVQQ
jgi:TonB family protein